MGTNCSCCQGGDGHVLESSELSGLKTVNDITSRDYNEPLADNVEPPDAMRIASDPGEPAAPPPGESSANPQTDTNAGDKAQASAVAATDPRQDQVSSDGMPVLLPIGSGGWNVPGRPEITPEMTRVKDEALKLLTPGRPEMTPFNTDFLTPITLQNYIAPPFFAPHLLAKAIAHRHATEQALNCKTPLFLNGSCRIVGWDAEGRTVIAHEPGTMRAPLAKLLDHFEYTFWNAVDMNKPGANGCVIILDVGGGYNWKHYLSVAALKEAMMLLKNCFHGRLAGLYMVDMPAAFRSIFNMALGYAEEETRKRIQCLSGTESLLDALKSRGLSPETLDTFRRYTEQRRDKKAVQTFSPVVDVPFFSERLKGLKLDANTESFTENHHKWLRQTIQEFRVHQWGIPSPTSD